MCLLLWIVITFAIPLASLLNGLGLGSGSSRALEHLARLHLEVVRDVVLQVADPFVVAGEEGAILVLIGRERLESGASVALLVAEEVLGHVVAHERLEQVQLEVILLIKLLALHGLRVCVVIVLVATIGEGVQELVLARQSQLGEDALFDVHAEAADSLLHLHHRLRLDSPVSGAILERIQRSGLLLAEEFGLGSLAHSSLQLSKLINY